MSLLEEIDSKIPESLRERVRQHLLSLTPVEFQHFIAEHFRSRSAEFIEVMETADRGPDGAYDIRFKTKSILGQSITYAVECKRTEKSITRNDADTIIALLNRPWCDAVVAVMTTTPSSTPTYEFDTANDKMGDRVIWKAWHGIELVKTLIEKTPHLVHDLLRKCNDYDLLQELISQHYFYSCFEMIVYHSVDPSRPADHFLNGFPATIDDIILGFDIDRTIYTKTNGILHIVKQALSGDSQVRVVALTGVEGTGKTTLLNRLAVDCAKDGIPVARLRAEWQLVSHDIKSQFDLLSKNFPNGVLILIDNASDFFYSVNKFGDYLIHQSISSNAIIVFAEHPSLWNVMSGFRQYLIEDTNFKHFPIGHLDNHECEQLIDRIIDFEQNGRISPKCDLPRDKRLNLCRDRARRQMIIALLQMRYGIRFDNIIQNEVERLSEPCAKEGYITTCFLNTINVTVPNDLLYKTLNLSRDADIAMFIRSTAGLFIENRFGLTARHRIIARSVVNSFLKSADSRRRVIFNAISKLNILQDEERRIFSYLFTSSGAHIRFKRILDNELDMLNRLFNDLENIQFIPINKDSLKYILSCHALTIRSSGESDKALDLLNDSLKIDPKYSFAIRQIAWILYRDKGELEKAAEMAIKGVEYNPDDFRANLDCAIILSENRYGYFLKAGQYFEKAIALNPNSSFASRKFERYDAARIESSHMSDLTNNSKLPKNIIETLRPGTDFLRFTFGPIDQRYKDAIINQLRNVNMQTDSVYQDDSYDEHNLDAPLSGRLLDALRLCNLGRMLYLDWYRYGINRDLEVIEKTFLRALELKNSESIIHCWYGTFLKEARGNYSQAMEEYQIALKLANQSSIKWLHDHPLFLNNIAILIMAEVQNSTRPKTELIEAYGLLQKAAEKVIEKKDKFFWPIDNLSVCKELMIQYNISKIPS